MNPVCEPLDFIHQLVCFIFGLCVLNRREDLIVVVVDLICVLENLAQCLRDILHLSTYIMEVNKCQSFQYMVPLRILYAVSQTQSLYISLNKQHHVRHYTDKKLLSL